jgi:hypothetical protein
MIHTLTIPEIKVTLETVDGTLPAGSMVQISVPVSGLPVTPVTTPPVTLSGVEGPKPIIIPPVEAKPTQPVTPPPVTSDPVSLSTGAAGAAHIEGKSPTPLPLSRLDRTYSPVEFRSSQQRSDTLGNAQTLGLSEADWTMVMEVRFVNFDHIHRVIGSASHSGAGSSLQIGVLEGGLIWMDTFMGGITGPKLELNRWYEIAISHHTTGEEKIYIDRKLAVNGGVPPFRSSDDVYVGKWVNWYSDFDMRRIRIFPLLSGEELQKV